MYTVQLLIVMRLRYAAEVLKCDAIRLLNNFHENGLSHSVKIQSD